MLLLDDLAYYINEEEYLYMVGAELNYQEKYFLRAGYRINLSETKNQSFNLGLGVVYKKYTIDYSLELNQDLNIPHRVSLGCLPHRSSSDTWRLSHRSNCLFLFDNSHKNQ